MHILINATALDARGGYTIIESFLDDISKEIDFFIAENIQITTLVARDNLSKFENEVIKIIYHPYPKKGMFHKWRYENIYLPKYIKEERIDVYLSLQNIGLRSINIPQYVLIHQPIPFSELKFSELELKNYIKYKIVLNYFYKRSLDKVDGIFVQTTWMKDAIIKKYRYKNKIHILRPHIVNLIDNPNTIDDSIKYHFNNEYSKLLYVTNDEKYKNNQLLIDAINDYNKNHNEKVMLYLTISGQSSNFIKYLGKIPRDKMFHIYSSVDALIFPSLTETLGLPLLEAAKCNLDILAADLPYAREVCKQKALYFNPREKKSITNVVYDYLLGRKNGDYKKNPNIKYFESPDSYIDYIKTILNEVSVQSETKEGKNEKHHPVRSL